MDSNVKESNLKFITNSCTFLDNQKKLTYPYYENNPSIQNRTFNIHKKTNTNDLSNILLQKNSNFQINSFNLQDINQPINFNDDIFNFKRNKSVSLLPKNIYIPNSIEYYIDENGNPNSFKNYNPLFKKNPIAYIITNNTGSNYLVDLKGERIDKNPDGDFYFPGQPYLLIKNFDVQNPELRVFGEGRRKSFKTEIIHKNIIGTDKTINDDDISFKNLTQPQIKTGIFNTIITNNNSSHLNKQKYLLFSSNSITNNNINKNSNYNHLSDSRQKQYYSLINSGRNSNFMKQYIVKCNPTSNKIKLKEKNNQKNNILPYNNKFQINLKNKINENVNFENFNNERSFIDDDSFHQINEKNKKNISISSTCSTNQYKPNNNNKKLNSISNNENTSSINSLNIYDVYFKKNCIDVGYKIKNKKLNTHNLSNKLFFNYERKNKIPITVNPLMKKEITEYNYYNNKNSNNNENNISLETEKQRYYTRVSTNRKIINSILNSINQAAINENKNKFTSNKRVNKYLLNDINKINENSGNFNYYKKPQKTDQINNNKSITANNNGIRKVSAIKNRGRNKSMINIYNQNKIHDLINNKSVCNFTPIKKKYKDESDNDKLNIITNITKCPHCHYIFTQTQQMN